MSLDLVVGVTLGAMLGFLGGMVTTIQIHSLSFRRDPEGWVTVIRQHAGQHQHRTKRSQR